MRTVTATRYLTPLREGGSLPAIVEADDLGLYVVKFRGAGQGTLALVSELLVGELARALDLPIPEIVLIEVDKALGRNEPDSEIRDLLGKSAGLNVALDYLPEALMFDPLVGPPPSAELASNVVWLDAFTANLDRTAKNPNLLRWHKRLYLIDHGAALYFHHRGESPSEAARRPFPAIQQHVLLPWASSLAESDRALRGQISAALFDDILSNVPDAWLTGDRRVYQDFFQYRLRSAATLIEEAERARARLI